MFPEFIPSKIAVVASPIRKGLIVANTVDMIPQIIVKPTLSL